MFADHAKRLIALDKYKPSNVDADPELETKCSWYVADVASACGNKDLLGLNANAQLCRMRNRPLSYKRISLSEGQVAANGGCLVILGWSNPKAGRPGHVCIVVPGESQLSKKWGAQAPVVASAGLECFYGRLASFAFSPEKVQALECYLWTECP